MEQAFSCCWGSGNRSKALSTVCTKKQLQNGLLIPWEILTP